MFLDLEFRDLVVSQELKDHQDLQEVSLVVPQDPEDQQLDLAPIQVLKLQEAHQVVLAHRSPAVHQVVAIQDLDLQPLTQVPDRPHQAQLQVLQDSDRLPVALLDIQVSLVQPQATQVPVSPLLPEPTLKVHLQVPIQVLSLVSLAPELIQVPQLLATLVDTHPSPILAIPRRLHHPIASIFRHAGSRVQ